MGCVCIWSICGVVVFTSDGVYVTSFGQRGNKEGDFNYIYVILCMLVTPEMIEFSVVFFLLF